MRTHSYLFHVFCICSAPVGEIFWDVTVYHSSTVKYPRAKESFMMSIWVNTPSLSSFWNIHPPFVATDRCLILFTLHCRKRQASPQKCPRPLTRNWNDTVGYIKSPRPEFPTDARCWSCFYMLQLITSRFKCLFALFHWTIGHVLKYEVQKATQPRNGRDEIGCGKYRKRTVPRAQQKPEPSMTAMRNPQHGHRQESYSAKRDMKRYTNQMTIQDN